MTEQGRVTAPVTHYITAYPPSWGMAARKIVNKILEKIKKAGSFSMLVSTKLPEHVNEYSQEKEGSLLKSD